MPERQSNISTNNSTSFQLAGELFGYRILAGILGVGYRVEAMKLTKIFIRNTQEIDDTRAVVMVCHSICNLLFLLAYGFFLISNASFKFLLLLKPGPI